jgi:DNA-directed RNA polymerase specialized sigma24 family protein
VSGGADRADPDAALLKALCDKHAAVLWRYALRITRDASQAEDAVQETLLRARQHPEVVGDAERSARAWLFTVAPHLIIDERRSARFRHAVSSLDNSSTPEQFAPDEVNAALDGLLIADAMTQLSVRTSGGDRAFLLQGMDHCSGRRRPPDRPRNSEVSITLWSAGTPTHAATDGGDTMTALRPSRALIGPNAKWRRVIGSTLRPPRYNPCPRVSVPAKRWLPETE